MNGHAKSALSAAIISILLWASLASLVAALTLIPPFWLTGIGLLIGGSLLLPWWRQWRVPWSVFWIGSMALFCYHAALFTALKTAPVVSVNLINYLWPLLIVVLAPLFDRQQPLRRMTIVAALLGFVGAAMAVAGEQMPRFDWTSLSGYLLALVAAFIWSCYSLVLKRLPTFASPAVGGFSLMAGGCSVLVALIAEPWPALQTKDAILLALIAAGPLGFAFYFWDKAAKTLASKTLGMLSFMTPVLSTTLLLISTGKPLTPQLLISAVLVFSATALVMFRRD